MREYQIYTGTITYAIKGRDVLRRHGYKSHVERISAAGKSGCGYTIVAFGDISKIEGLLRKAGVKFLEISEM